VIRFRHKLLEVIGSGLRFFSFTLFYYAHTEFFFFCLFTLVFYVISPTLKQFLVSATSDSGGGGLGIIQKYSIPNAIMQVSIRRRFRKETPWTGKFKDSVVVARSCALKEPCIRIDKCQ